jgi:hypothetical protein
MANDFSDAVAAWFFAAGALTADSIGTNTLTDHGSVGSGTAIQGAATVSLNGSSKYFDIADSSLAAGFPFKNGDSGRLITVVCKFRPGSTGEHPLAGKMAFGSSNCFGLTFNLNYFMQYNAGYNNGSSEVQYLINGNEYQIAYVIDGINKICKIYVYNYTAGTWHSWYSWTPSSTLAGSTLAWRIGYDSGRSAYANGDIGEIVVFNKLLTEDDIESITLGVYRNTEPGGGNSWANDSNVKAAWNFSIANILADSKSTNTLTRVRKGVVGVPAKQGITSLHSGDENANYLNILDSNLVAGFPLKSGDTTKVISVCCWVRMSATSSCIWSKFNTGSKRSLALDIESGKFRILWGTGNGSSSDAFDTGIAVSNNTWYHVAAMVDGVNKTLTVRVYNDTTQSVSTYTGSPGNVLWVGDAAWCIGNREDGGNVFKGFIDEVVVFNRLLSNADVDVIRAGTYQTQQNITPSGVSSGESFGTTTIIQPQSLGISGIATAEAMGSPSLAPIVASSGIAPAEAFGVCEVTHAGIGVTGIVTAEVVGSPQLNLQAMPGGIESVETLGTATITLFVKPEAISPAAASGDPAILVGTVIVAPAAIDSQEGFGDATLVPGQVEVLPVSIGTGEAVAAPVLYPYVVLTMGGVASEEAHGSPQLNQNVKPSGVTSEQAFGSPQLNLRIKNFFYYYYSYEIPGRRYKVDGIPTDCYLAPNSGPHFKDGAYYPQAWVSTHSVVTLSGGPQIISQVTIEPLFDDFPEPTIIPGRVDAFPSGVASEETLGGAEVIPGPVTVAAEGIGLAEIGNGGFEFGNFTGWVQSGDLEYTEVADASVYYPVHSGGHVGLFGPWPDLGFLAQTLATVPGESYTLRFWLQNGAFNGSGELWGQGENPRRFLVYWNGGLIWDVTQEDFDNQEFLYREFVFESLVATSIATELKFGFNNETDYWLIDDISVGQVGTPSLTYKVNVSGIATAEALGAALEIIPGPVWIYPPGIEGGEAHGLGWARPPREPADLIVLEVVPLATLEFTDGLDVADLYDSPLRMVANG